MPEQCNFGATATYSSPPQGQPASRQGQPDGAGPTESASDDPWRRGQRSARPEVASLPSLGGTSLEPEPPGDFPLTVGRSSPLKIATRYPHLHLVEPIFGLVAAVAL